MDSEILSGIIGAIAAVLGAVIAIIPQIRKTNDRIDSLFYYTMSGPMYENLAKLVDGQFMDYIMSDGLKRELYYLRDTGFIEITDKSGGSIRNIPGKGDNLQQYVRVQNVGRRFVEMRRKLESDGKRLA
jgi:hypothetical protein